LLHGNYIAKKKDNQLWVSHAGWKTNTTKSRLNSLSGVCVVQKDFIFYLNGNEMIGGWNEVN
jgi:predicted amidohydrolase YtcJ